MAGPVAVGGQDCHPAAAGAHTGDISAPQLRDAGATWVILGHSERRQDHGESDALVRAKLQAARAAGLKVILCLGESRAQREAGTALEVVAAQLAASLAPDLAAASPEAIAIAYEPIWAIGTGLIPSPEQIEAMHRTLRETLRKLIGPAAEAVRLLYGGSVKGSNAAAIFAIPEVDGALVGGASLRAADFRPIIEALGG